MHTQNAVTVTSKGLRLLFVKWNYKTTIFSAESVGQSWFSLEEDKLVSTYSASFDDNSQIIL